MECLSRSDIPEALEVMFDTKSRGFLKDYFDALSKNVFKYFKSFMKGL